MTDNEPPEVDEQPEKPKVRVPVGDPDPISGQYREYVEADEDAAAHWDARRWERLS